MNLLYTKFIQVFVKTAYSIKQPTSTVLKVMRTLSVNTGKFPNLMQMSYMCTLSQTLSAGAICLLFSATWLHSETYIYMSTDTREQTHWRYGGSQSSKPGSRMRCCYCDNLFGYYIIAHLSKLKVNPKLYNSHFILTAVESHLWHL